jgi:putative ABC transport system substrate-binding protein
MRKQEFAILVTLFVCLAPVSAYAEQKVWRLGFLTPGYRDSGISSRITAVAELEAYGFVEGKNLVVDARHADGAAEQLPELARELAQLRPDAIIAVTNPAIRAARQAAPDTPVVMAFAGEDPVAGGLVSSMARPGGMVTGMALLAEQSDPKRVELMAQAVPGAKRIVLLASRYADEDRIRRAGQFANALGIELTVVRAQNSADYNAVFSDIAKSGAAALVVGSSPVFFRDAADLAARAANVGIPILCEWREMADRGCTFAYGPDVQSMYRTVGRYVARLFKGEKPSDLPIEQPTKFDFTINLRAAKALGLTIPPTLLARADEVIE